MNGCPIEHDPIPFSSSAEGVGITTTFAPRPGYCQDRDHYEPPILEDMP